MTNKTSDGGQTWSDKEQKCLLEIQAEKNISQLLEQAHKNTEVFKIFSDKNEAKWIEQLRSCINNT